MRTPAHHLLHLQHDVRGSQSAVESLMSSAQRPTTLVCPACGCGSCGEIRHPVPFFGPDSSCATDLDIVERFDELREEGVEVTIEGARHGELVCRGPWFHEGQPTAWPTQPQPTPIPVTPAVQLPAGAGRGKRDRQDLSEGEGGLPDIEGGIRAREEDGKKPSIRT